MPPSPALGRHLDDLLATRHTPSLLDHDPVRYVHRYSDPADQEVAAVFASGLAFGRVDLFFPVLTALFDHLDAHGGPRHAAMTAAPARDAPLHALYYRWTRGADLALLLDATGALLRAHGGLEPLFAGAGARERLTAGVHALREACLEAAPRHGLPAGPFPALPRGLRALLSSPSDGSACKRWNLAARWLVRAPDGVDLGLWRTWRPDELVMPLDVHVHRVARFLGLTRRADTSWRTAVEVTDALRRFDPADPVRYDFALAHLGISGGCRGGRHADVCPSCPLDPVCAAAPLTGVSLPTPPEAR